MTLTRARTYMCCLVVALTLGITSSCGDSVMSGRLSEIESYIEKHPADALESLRSIDASEVSGRADKAKYALLMRYFG